MYQLSKLSHSLPSDLHGKSSEPGMGKKEIAEEFEKIFTRQLVEQMTNSLFENEDGKGVMRSGGAMYKDHIVDVLSAELARQESTGIAEIVRSYWPESPADDGYSDEEPQNSSDSG